MDAQDRALALLACQRGMVAPAALRAAFPGLVGQTAAQGLVRAGLLDAGAVAGLLRDLARGAFQCERCRVEVTYDRLAGRERIVCERCAGPLTFAAVAPRGSSQFARPVRGTDRFAPPPPPPTTLPRFHQSDDLDKYVSEDLTDTTPPNPSSSWGSIPNLAAASGAVPAVVDTGRFTTDRGAADGRRLGPYVIEKELGRGSNGVVYLARRPGVDGPLALKVLRDADIADEETIKRFELEAAVAQKLRDPGIIAVYDVGREGDTRYFVMEYCPGKTLKERLAEGKLPPAEAAQLILALARAMAVAHEAGVIHRDLKPANVILDQATGRPRVTDFGLARDRSLLQSMTRTGDVIGTPFYMAPEQLRGEKDLDARIDVYALGVLLYEALTGKRPFTAETFIQLVEVVTKGPPPPPPGELVPEVSRALDAVVLKCLGRDRRTRYRSAAELADDLERVLSDKAPRAPLPARRPGDPAPLDARVAVAAGAGALLLVGLGIAVALALGGPRGPTTSTDVARPGDLDPAALRARLEEVLALAPPARRAALEALRPAAARDGALRARLEVELRRAATLEALAAVTGSDAAAAGQGAPLDRAADAALDRARAAAGGDAALLREVALAAGARHLRRGRYDEALRALEAAAQDDGAAGREARRLRGQALEKLGKAEEARRAYASAEEDETLTGFCARAARKRLEGELAAADLNTLSALARDPDHVPALLEQARTGIERADLKQAAAALERARTLAEGDPELHVLTGRLRLRGGDAESAEQAAVRALALTEGAPDPDALALRAAAAIAARPPRLEAAAHDLLEALRRAPGNVEALVWRGLLHLRRGDRGPSQEDWRRAWELDRARCDRLARLLVKEDADAFREANAARPPQPATERPGPGPGPALPMIDPTALFSLGDVDPIPEKLPPRVKAAVERRAQAIPAAIRGDLQKALLAAARGRPWSEAAFSLNRAMRFAPDGDAGGHLEQVRLHVARDQVQDAARLVQDARSRGGPARELERLAAEALWRAGRAGEALRAYEALAAADPDGVEGRCAAAQVQLLRGAPEAARAAAEKALELDAGHVPSLLARAVALQQQGESALAQGALERVYEREGAIDSRFAALRFLNLVLKDGLHRQGDRDKLPDHIVFHAFDAPFVRALVAECLLARRNADANDLDLARGLLERARTLDPRRPHTHLLLARWALLARRDKAEVLAAWRAAREAAPGEPLPEQDVKVYGDRFGEPPPSD